MAEQATSRRSDPAARGSDQVATLQAELAASREEALRLRDLLISKDAELGKLSGEIAQLEAGTARVLHLVSRIKGLPRSALHRVLGLFRRQG